MSEAPAGRERPQTPVLAQGKKDTSGTPKPTVPSRHPQAGRGL